MKQHNTTYSLSELILIAIDNLGYSACGAPIKKSLAALGWQVKAEALKSSLGELEQKGLVFTTVGGDTVRRYHITRDGFRLIDKSRQH